MLCFPLLIRNVLMFVYCFLLIKIIFFLMFIDSEGKQQIVWHFSPCLCHVTKEKCWKSKWHITHWCFLQVVHVILSLSWCSYGITTAEQVACSFLCRKSHCWNASWCEAEKSQRLPSILLLKLAPGRRGKVCRPWAAARCHRKQNFMPWYHYSTWVAPAAPLLLTYSCPEWGNRPASADGASPCCAAHSQPVIAASHHPHVYWPL